MVSLRVASLLAGALVVASLVARLANPYDIAGPTASGLVPHLWGVGAMVVVALAQGWAPTVAWAGAVVASTTAAIGAVGLVREVRLMSPERGLPAVDALLAVALVVPLVVAAAYASTGGTRSRPVTIASWAAVAAMTVVFGVNAARRVLGEETGGVPQWTWLAVIGALALLGLVRDLRPVMGRTRQRTAGGQDGDAVRGRLSVVRVFVDELVPGRDAGRAEAAETERGRLAADLHAEVLPSLRRALAKAEDGGSVERLAADLRAAVDEVESLLLSRRSIVLEELGLLAGIEWLAERVEDRSAVRVEIEVDGAMVDDAGAALRPPREVERAAFRVAQLALDNVVRHAPRSTARVWLGVGPGRIDLRVEDDGEGLAVDEGAAVRSGRRGIADMRAEARACGAVLDIGRGDGGRGTLVTFAWPA